MENLPNYKKDAVLLKIQNLLEDSTIENDFYENVELTILNKYKFNDNKSIIQDTYNFEFFVNDKNGNEVSSEDFERLDDIDKSTLTYQYFINSNFNNDLNVYIKNNLNYAPLKAV